MVVRVQVWTGYVAPSPLCSKALASQVVRAGGGSWELVGFGFAEFEFPFPACFLCGFCVCFQPIGQWFGGRELRSWTLTPLLTSALGLLADADAQEKPDCHL